MTERGERLLTVALVVLTALAAAWAAWPARAPRGPVRLETSGVTVAVSGEVKRPGVYALPPGARTRDAVSAAGGLTARADPGLVRLAQAVEDGDTVRVPARTVSGPGVGAPRARVNLNAATAAELESLPGVGSKLAARVIAGRPYRDARDLDRVKGVGPALLARLEPLVTY